MNPQQMLDSTYREQVRDQAMKAALSYLCSRNRDWLPTSRLDVDELLITAPTADHPFYIAELFWSKNDKRRRIQWPGRASDGSEPIIAQLLLAETLIYTLADCFVLLSAAAIIAERPIDVFYPYFHERYRAHPNGQLELVEETKKP